MQKRKKIKTYANQFFREKKSLNDLYILGQHRPFPPPSRSCYPKSKQPSHCTHRANFAPHRLFDTTPLAQSQRSVPASQRSQLRHLHMETLKRESWIRNFASGSAIEYFLSHWLGEPFPVPPPPQQRSTPPQKLLSKGVPSQTLRVSFWRPAEHPDSPRCR